MPKSAEWVSVGKQGGKLLTREELDKKIEEARKRSEVLSQAEIDEVLKQIPTNFHSHSFSL